MQIKTLPNNLSAYKKSLSFKEAVHAFLHEKGFLEVELPVLSPELIPESYLEVFKTEFIYTDKKQALYLTPSPELFLKRLLTRGIGDCYSIGKSFRNSDPPSPLHSFEFTMFELYKTHASYMDIADLVLEMLQFVNKKLNGKESDTINYNGVSVSLKKWEKISVAEAFLRYAHIEEEQLFDHKKLLEAARKKGYVVADSTTYEDIFSQLYVQEVEPHLGMNGLPTLIYDYPTEFAALAKLNEDRKTAQRFEFYIAGVELGDCYSELTDWKEQEKRFEEEDGKRKQGGRIAHPIDKGFIQALQYGLEPCAGIAIGFDRLAAIFANVKTIEETKLITIS